MMHTERNMGVANLCLVTVSLLLNAVFEYSERNGFTLINVATVLKYNNHWQSRLPPPPPLHPKGCHP